MPKYIFLDNWVLDQYTREDKVAELSEFITKNKFVILITTLLLTELYNPGWENATNPEQERGYRVVKFLAQHQCVIADQVKLFRAEIEEFPNKLEDMPMELDLINLSFDKRQSEILKLLRSDPSYVEQRIDIRVWRTKYDYLKTNWLETMKEILDHAISKGTLHKSKNGEPIAIESEKDEFLATLDRRHFIHFSSDERVKLGEKIVDLFMGHTRNLPATRLTSLCFWYMYIETDSKNLPRHRPSDIGDFYHMSMIPYCHTFTVDGTMFRLLKRIEKDLNYDCAVFNETELNNHLGLTTIP